MKIKVSKSITVNGKVHQTYAESEYPDPKKGWGDYPEDMDRRVSRLANERVRGLFNSMESKSPGIGAPFKMVEGESFESTIQPDYKAFMDWMLEDSGDFKSIAPIKALSATWKAALKYARNQK